MPVPVRGQGHRLPHSFPACKAPGGKKASRLGVGVSGTTPFLGLQQGPLSILLGSTDGSDATSEEPSLRAPLPVFPNSGARPFPFGCPSCIKVRHHPESLFTEEPSCVTSTQSGQWTRGSQQAPPGPPLAGPEAVTEETQVRWGSWPLDPHPQGTLV